MKNEFIKILKENVKRQGIEKLISWLESTDFFTAPASAKYHSCHEGGLCEHSVKVYYRLRKLMELESETMQLSDEDKEKIAIVALLHDLCKINFYKADTRNVKIDGEWKQVPYYSYTNRLSLGHGAESVDFARRFIKLTNEEIYAIRYHMGFSEQSDMSNVGKAFRAYPLALALHLADMQATYLDEKEE